MTTTRETADIVHNPSRIVDTKPVDDHTPSDLASSTAVDDPSHDEIDVVNTSALEAVLLDRPADRLATLAFYPSPPEKRPPRSPSPPIAPCGDA